MNVSDFKPVPNSKLDKISQLLNTMYGIQLDWSCSDEQLRDMMEHYKQKRLSVLAESSNVNVNPEYTKFVLITEAIRLFLTEIAPKRRKTRRK